MILVTGATGHFGHAVIQFLMDKGIGNGRLRIRITFGSQTNVY